MNIVFHGHACTEIVSNSVRLLIDPWLRGNPIADITPDEVKPDYILLTHGHFDHLGDAIEIAAACDCTIIAVSELAKYCAAQGARVQIMNIGGCRYFQDFSVKMVRADHSSSIPTEGGNIYAGSAVGYIICCDGKRIYHAGDTALYSDMCLYADPPLDLAILPIGDSVTMGIDDACRAAALLKSHLVLPIHYNSFPAVQCDPKDFGRTLQFRVPECTCCILQPGEVLQL